MKSVKQSGDSKSLFPTSLLVVLLLLAGSTGCALEQESPSETAVLTPTIDFTPTPQPSPTATLSLPFYDDFNDEASSFWKIFSGDWVIVDGRYTVKPKDASSARFDISSLSGSYYSDYLVSMEIYLESAPGESRVAAILFLTPYDVPPYLGMFLYDSSFAFANINMSVDDVYNLEGFGEYSIPPGSNLSIEVHEDTFIARVNGAEIQRVTVPGYEKTAVGLLILCHSDTPCPSFDMFKIDPLP